MTEVQTKIKYRYIVTDLLSNQILAEIPFTGVTYERALKSAGKFQGNISINIDTQGLDLYNSTMPGKTGLYIMRNDECVWGGIIWSREYNVTGQELSVSASEFTSYLHHRRIWKTFLREFNGVKVNRFNASLLKVKLPSGSPITISSGSTVELIFDEARAYNYRGHYKVVGDYVNASTIYVEDVPVEAFTGKPIAFDGDYREDEATKSQIKTYKITNRQMVKGSKEITVSTSKVHDLVPGDVVKISGMDVNTGLVDYTVTTGSSTPLTLEGVQIAFKKFIPVGTSKVKYQFEGTTKSRQIDQYMLQPLGDGLTGQATFYIGVGGQEAQMSPYPWASLDPLTPGVTDASFWGISIGTVINIAGLSGGANNGALIDERLNGSFVVIDKGFGYLPVLDSPTAFEWFVTFTVALPITGTAYTFQSGSAYVYYYNSNGTLDGDWRFWLDTGDLETGQSVVVTEATGNAFLNNKTFKIVDVSTISDLTTNKSTFLFNTVEYAKWTGATPPTIPGANNATVSRVVHTKDVLKNVSAADLNKLNNEIVAVPTANTFTVLSNLPSSVSSNVAQTVASAEWNPIYKATMHANTDTYDYVRLLLGHVFSDFSTVPSSSGFLGTDVTNGIRKITYNEADEKVLLETGFVESAYSKEIKQDSLTVNQVKLSKNLATATLTLDTYTVTAGSYSGSNTIVTYTSNNSLIPGDVVSVDD